MAPGPEYQEDFELTLVEMAETGLKVEMAETGLKVEMAETGLKTEMAETDVKVEMAETDVKVEFDDEVPETSKDDSVESEVSKYEDGKGKRYFCCAIVSNILFFIASALYTWLGVLGLHYEQASSGIPDEVWLADDDYTWSLYWADDDYVFQTKQGEWISLYQIVYFWAAMCFVLVGLIDFTYKPGCFGIFMIMAGGFGSASAILVARDENLSNIFNMVSVHLFLLEALSVLLRRQNFQQVKHWYLMAALFFLTGTLFDVALSWVVYFEKFSITFAKLAIVGACLWIACSLIYIGITLYDIKRWRRVKHIEEHQETPELSDNEVI